MLVKRALDAGDHGQVLAQAGDSGPQQVAAASRGLAQPVQGFGRSVRQAGAAQPGVAQYHAQKRRRRALGGQTLFDGQGAVFHFCQHVADGRGEEGDGTVENGVFGLEPLDPRGLVG